MVLTDIYKVPIPIALAVVLGSLGLSIAVSLLRPAPAEEAVAAAEPAD
jgi:hypothetical protein